MQDYFAEAYSGVGSASLDEVGALVKALEANETETNVANLTGVGALQYQSLEDTLAILTTQEKHLTIYRDMPRGSNAKSTIEEYSVQTGHGAGDGGWVDQSETPIEQDPQIKRDFSVVKFLRELWRVSDVSTLVGTITESETIAKRSAMMRAMRKLNRSLYSGDSSLIPQSIDGFEAVIRAAGSQAHIIDARGGVPSQENFDQLGEVMSTNLANVEGAGLYCSPGGINTLAQILKGGTTGLASDSVQRVVQGQVDSSGKVSMGFGVKEIHTPFGTILPKYDVYLGGEYENHGAPTVIDPTNPRNVIEGPTSVRAPATPTVGVANPGGAPVAGSKWLGSGESRVAGNYRYRVYAVNRFGKSMASAASGAVAVAATEVLNITITPVASAYPATGFVVLGETAEGSGIYRYIGHIAANGNNAVVFTDDNSRIPGTTTMFLLDLSSTGEGRSCAMKQLAPIHSQEYARISPQRWGTVNHYLGIHYYAPFRFTMLTNVKVGVPNAGLRYLNV